MWLEGQNVGVPGVAGRGQASRVQISRAVQTSKARCHATLTGLCRCVWVLVGVSALRRDLRMPVPLASANHESNFKSSLRVHYTASHRLITPEKIGYAF